jgi:hypothetical protein
MTTISRIPSELDWGDYSADLDEEYAHRTFAGKSLEEAIPLFQAHVIERCGELQFMPLIPFQYYMYALRNYVMSERVLTSDMSCDAASCFLGLVLLKLRDAPASIMPIMEDMMPAIEYVVSNQILFDADIDIYGDFTEKLTELKRLLERGKAQ